MKIVSGTVLLCGIYMISAYPAGMSVYVQNQDPKHTITVKEIRYNKKPLHLDSLHVKVKQGGRKKVGAWNVPHAQKNNWGMVIQVNCSNNKGGITPIKICYAAQCKMNKSDSVILNVNQVDCKLLQQQGKISATSVGYIDALAPEGFIETLFRGGYQRCHPFKGSSSWC